MDKLLQNEVFVRLLALAVAVAVYLASHGTGSGTVQRSVPSIPVEVVGLPQGMVLTGINPPTVQVTVTGPAPIVNTLDPALLSAAVNLAAVKSGTSQVFVKVAGPTGLQITATAPPDVNVAVEPQQTADFAVQVDTQGQPAAGFALDSSATASVQPPYVIVTGPQSLVARVQRVAVTVPLGGARSTLAVNAAPVAEDKGNHPVAGVTVNPKQVYVRVPIAAVISSKTVPVHPQTAGRPPAGYAVTGVAASPAEVKLVGPQASLDALSAATTASVPVSGTSTFRDQVQVVQPPGVTAVQPAQVTVTVTIQKSS